MRLLHLTSYLHKIYQVSIKKSLCRQWHEQSIHEWIKIIMKEFLIVVKSCYWIACTTVVNFIVVIFIGNLIMAFLQTKHVADYCEKYRAVFGRSEWVFQEETTSKVIVG
jgi:hypothetical protein